MATNEPNTSASTINESDLESHELPGTGANTLASTTNESDLEPHELPGTGANNSASKINESDLESDVLPGTGANTSASTINESDLESHELPGTGANTSASTTNESDLEPHELPGTGANNSASKINESDLESDVLPGTGANTSASTINESDLESHELPGTGANTSASTTNESDLESHELPGTGANNSASKINESELESDVLPGTGANTSASTINESDLEFHELVGSGGSGEVYRVTWKRENGDNIQAAAKKIPKVDGKSMYELLDKEVHFHEKLKHPNVIEYYGHIVTETHVIIVLEYAAQGSLFDYLKDKHHLPLELRQQWAIEAAKGIKHLMENNVAHRDIKSPNFLITAENILKISDFGISKDLTNTKTTNNVIGSIRWLAPEVFKDSKLSQKADIFALGVVLWELQTCELPYKSKTNEQVLWAVGHEDLRPAIPSNCPRTLKNIIIRCWHKDRNERPQLDDIIKKLELMLPSELKEVDPSLQLHFRHDLKCKYLLTVYWLDHQRIVLCDSFCVRVYKVTTEGSTLAYTITLDKPLFVCGAAVSKSMPDSMICIGTADKCVYQLPCCDASKEINTFKIKGDMIFPFCLVANDTTAYIGIYSEKRLIVCRLPDFKHQSEVLTSIIICDLSITADYLLVVGENGEMIVKPIGDMSQDLCKIEDPLNEFEFDSASITSNAREIYASILGEGRVVKYTWDGSGTPQYTLAGCVLNNLDEQIRNRCLGVSPARLLALRADNLDTVKVYSLEM